MTTPKTPLPWTWLPDRSLAQIEEAAIRSSFHRHNGNRSKMMRELHVSKSTLLRKLSRLGLRGRLATRVRHLREPDIARSFQRHRRAIAAELKIADSTLMRWLEKKMPELLEATR